MYVITQTDFHPTRGRITNMISQKDYLGRCYLTTLNGVAGTIVATLNNDNDFFVQRIFPKDIPVRDVVTAMKNLADFFELEMVELEEVSEQIPDIVKVYSLTLTSDERKALRNCGLVVLENLLKNTMDPEYQPSWWDDSYDLTLYIGEVAAEKITEELDSIFFYDDMRDDVILRDKLMDFCNRVS